jgi:hypothetical protein
MRQSVEEAVFRMDMQVDKFSTHGIERAIAVRFRF